MIRHGESTCLRRVSVEQMGWEPLGNACILRAAAAADVTITSGAGGP